MLQASRRFVRLCKVCPVGSANKRDRVHRCCTYLPQAAHERKMNLLKVALRKDAVVALERRGV